MHALDKQCEIPYSGKIIWRVLLLLLFAELEVLNLTIVSKIHQITPIFPVT